MAKCTLCNVCKYVSIAIWFVSIGSYLINVPIHAQYFDIWCKTNVLHRFLIFVAKCAHVKPWIPDFEQNHMMFGVKRKLFSCG